MCAFYGRCGADFAQLHGVRRSTSAVPRVVIACLITLAVTACSSPGNQLERAQEKIQGLTATTHAIGEAWLIGDVSPTYAGTAFEQTLQLLDKQRAALNASPTLLLDPRGASLSRDAEQLSRVLAALVQDAKNRDQSSGRGHLSQVPAPNGGASR
jgi:hypothetical protein